MYENLPDSSKSVNEWTIDECHAYVSMAWESYSEMTAEAGMGAVSFGLDPYGAMATIVHPNSDPAFVAANRRIEANHSARSLVRVICVHPGDLPF
jgi:hypothetical protein